MDLALTEAQRELRERAARYVDDVLIPLEEGAELAGGRLPGDAAACVKEAARAARLTGGNHAVEHGGQGWSAFEQVLVQEEPGIEVVDDPPFTHNYPHGHPTVRYDCEVAADAVLGGDAMIGRGGELQNEWFVEERIHIAARCVGAMRRLLGEAVAWAIGREQF